jgi:MFS family permease
MTALEMASGSNNGADGSNFENSWFQGITRYHWMVFIGCWMGGIFDGMDSTLMTVVGPKAIAELVGSTDKLVIGPVASYIGAVFLLGWMVGGVLFGIMGDRLGRVKSMIFSILLYALFTGLAGLAQDWHQLALCRFLTGLGIGGELVSISTFLAEVWPARSRAIAIGALITSYQAGVFIAGAINTAFHGWREAFWIGVLPAILVVFLRMALRESDRWVEAKERQRQAGQSVSPWGALFRREHLKPLLVGSLAFGGLLIGYWASLSWIPFWIQDLLHGGGTGSERGIATMYQGVAAMLGCSLAGVFADWIGRRATIALSSFGCFVVSALLFLSFTEFSPLIYGYAALLGFFIGMIQAVMYIYLPELFPTLVRASGTGFCLNLGRLVTAVSVFFVSDMIKLVTNRHLASVLFGNAALSAYGVAALLFAVFYLIGVIAAMLGEETRGRALLE